jgi:hypothetical protein
MQLFDLVKNIFSNNEKVWKSVGRIDKSRNFFMVNRIMSIQFPIQANQFNKLKITPPPVIDWWRDTLSHRFSKPPVWVYTKTKKTEKPEISKVKEFPETESFIREKYKISKRDLLQLKEFYPDKYQEWVSDIAEQTGLQK